MQDLDPVETQEWLDALESVLDREGEDRAHYLMTRMGELATRSGTPLPYGITTPYRNTIPVTREAKMPDTFPPLPPARRSMTSASTTSSRLRPKSMAAT